jgi:hypothetical protein
MPRQRRIDPFYLVIYDKDRKLFNVVGPIQNDIPWTEKIESLKNKGKMVTCQTIRDWSKKEIIENCQKDGEYTFTEENLV